jgi:hypothetical protein
MAFRAGARLSEAGRLAEIATAGRRGIQDDCRVPETRAIQPRGADAESRTVSAQQPRRGLRPRFRPRRLEVRRIFGCFAERARVPTGDRRGPRADRPRQTSSLAGRGQGPATHAVRPASSSRIPIAVGGRSFWLEAGGWGLEAIPPPFSAAPPGLPSSPPRCRRAPASAPSRPVRRPAHGPPAWDPGPPPGTLPAPATHRPCGPP